MKILCIMLAHNEEDIIYQSVKAYVDEGIDVYLINNASTDNTVAEARRAGIKWVENFPEEVPGYSNDCVGKFIYAELLKRTEDVAEFFNEYDWFITSAADEFRESPFINTSLAEGIKFIDRLGYNCLHHIILYFYPVDDYYIPKISDPRRHFRYWDYFKHYKRGNLTVWKNQKIRIKLCHPDGERIEFPGMKMFPVPFILRHYSIRGIEHGRKKMQERLGRYIDQETSLGWHYQYNEYKDGNENFIKDPKTLHYYDSTEFRYHLLDRSLKDLLTLFSLHEINLFDNLDCSDKVERWTGRSCKEITEMSNMLDKVISTMMKGQSVSFSISTEEKDLFLALLHLKSIAARLAPCNSAVSVCEILRKNVKTYLDSL